MSEFEISRDLKEKGIDRIALEGSVICIYCNKERSCLRVYRENVQRTLQELDKLFNGSIDPLTKESLKLTISSQWSTKVLVSKEGRKDEKEQVTKSKTVMQVAKCHITKLFVDEYQVPHAAISIDNLHGNHLEILRLDSKRLRNWLSRALYKELNIIVDDHSLNDVLGFFNAQAEFDSGEPIKLNLRVAEKKITDGSGKTKIVWYYDLTNLNYEAIEITSAGWKVANNLIIFRRFNNQLAQVYPSREYPPDIFDRFMKLMLSSNVENEDTRKEYILLLKCYIICLFVPEISKAVLMPHGPQGSAKTTLLNSVKTIVDPSVIKTLSIPGNVNELIQQLSHNYVAIYDNISVLPNWASDQFCRAVTGSGSSKRKLFTDDEDIIYSLKRCIAINGINLAATKPDLLDRGMPMELRRIENKDRRKEQYILDEFEKMIPQLLGYILDVLVKVIRMKESNGIELTEFPRMADFAECGEMISRCMGFPENAFVIAYQNNIKVQISEIIESNQIATCIRELIFSKYEEHKEWIGTPSSLLLELEVVAESLKINIRGRYWPKAPNALSRRLKEIIPTLREIGVEIEFLTNQGPTKARLIKISKKSSTSSILSPE